MEVMILIAAPFILYLLFSNRKVAEQMAVETNPVAKAQQGCAIGVGWYIIILLAAVLALTSIVGVGNLDIGYMPDGSFTLTQQPDPNNPLARPIGEIVGYHDDGTGHWVK